MVSRMRANNRVHGKLDAVTGHKGSKGRPPLSSKGMRPGCQGGCPEHKLKRLIGHCFLHDRPSLLKALESSRPHLRSNRRITNEQENTT